MTCEEALILISGQLDERNTEEEAAQLRKHLEHCESCRNLMDAFIAVDAGILSLEEDAPDDLCANVMEAVRQELPGKKVRTRWAGLAVAAALILAVGVGGLGLQNGKDTAQPETAAYSLLADAAEDAAAPSLYAARSYSTAAVLLDPQALADEKGAPVAVVPELYYELETCELETLETGDLLYVLPDADAAAQLCRDHEGQLYEPSRSGSASVSYAVIMP